MWRRDQPGDTVNCLLRHSRVCSDHVTPSTVVRDWDIYLDSDVSMRCQVARTVSHCFGILRQFHSIRRSQSHSVFQSLVAALVLTKLDLRKCDTGRYPVVPARSSPAGHECSGSTRLPVQSTRPHHSAALPSALTSCAGANSAQTRLAGVPVCPWTGAGLPGGRSTACRWTSWLPDNACVHHRPRHWLYH